MQKNHPTSQNPNSNSNGLPAMLQALTPDMPLLGARGLAIVIESDRHAWVDAALPLRFSLADRKWQVEIANCYLLPPLPLSEALVQAERHAKVEAEARATLPPHLQLLRMVFLDPKLL